MEPADPGANSPTQLVDTMGEGGEHGRFAEGCDVERQIAIRGKREGHGLRGRAGRRSEWSPGIVSAGRIDVAMIRQQGAVRSGGRGTIRSIDCSSATDGERRWGNRRAACDAYQVACEIPGTRLIVLSRG